MDLVLNRFWYQTVTRSKAVYGKLRTKVYKIKNRGK